MLLLERETQVSRLARMLAQARDGQGGLAVLVGEAGAGKTSIVRHFLQTAPDVRVMRSFCEDLSVPDPLGPLYDLARELQFKLPRDPERSQLSLFTAVLEKLNHRSEPTVVIIEDIHWADDATLDFIRFLGRRIDGTNLLLILTARTEGADAHSRLRRALVDVPNHSLVRLDVPMLSLAAVTELASATGLDGELVYGATAGNAFFVTELVASGARQALPESVAAAVLKRADKLSVDARAALDLVSLFPRRAETDLLPPILGSTAGLDEAIGSGLLELSADSIAFRHEIARRAVELAVPEAQRTILSTRILAALQTVPDVPVARLVHHARAASDPQVILTLTTAAGKWASKVGAHHEAADHFGAARQLAPGDAALAHALAFEYSLTGRLNDAIKIEMAALDLHRASGDRLQEGDSLRWLSRFSYLAGRRDDTDRYGDLAIAVLETEPPGPEMAMAYSNHAQLDMLAERLEPTLEWGRKAVELAERLGREDIVCATLNNIGNVQRWADPDEARRCLGRSLEMAIAHDWHEHAARAYANWSCMDIQLMDFSAAEQRLAAGIAYCAERDLDTLRLYMTGWLAQLRLRQGKWAMAAEVARQVLESDLATPLSKFQAADVVARLRVRRGDPDDGRPLEELQSVLAHGREFQRMSTYATLIAERAWTLGEEVTAALDVIEQAMDLIGEPAATKDLVLWRSVLRDDPADWAAVAAERQEAGMPFEHALALLMQGRGAEKKALVALKHLGATKVLARARETLSRRGLRGPRRSSLANEAGLTNRELEVLKLVSDGLSNKAIATKLRLSTKTVDHHVSAVLEKLAADSRGHAAALARERRLT